jgi:hypothetical protein
LGARKGTYVIDDGIAGLSGACSRSISRRLWVRRTATEGRVPVPSVSSVPPVMARIRVVDMFEGGCAGRAGDGIKFQ